MTATAHQLQLPRNVDLEGDRRLVFVSLEPWDEVWRRNQFVCRELAERGWEILFVEPAADWSAGLRRRRWEQFERRPMWSPSGLPAVKVLRPVKVMPKAAGWGQAINQKLWDARVGRALKQLSWERPDLWVNNQLLWPAASGTRRSRWSQVLYDVTDDWSMAGGAESWLEQVRRDDAAMADAADAVVVCSEALAEARLPNWGEKLHVVPNGVDLEHFAQVDAATVATDLAELPSAGLRLGYSGTVHPDRLDVDLVAAAAAARPDWSWVFIGPCHLGEADRGRLGLPNVHFLGPRPYADLPGYLAGIDVCVTPHRVTDFTESLNPIKLWEYLAVGHPIVSTPVAGFRDFPDEVALAAGLDEWLAAVEATGAAPAERRVANRDRRRRRVYDESWLARARVLEAILRGAAPESDRGAKGSLAGVAS